MKQDFILDFETIGQNVMKCPIVDVAYVAFDWDRFLTDPYSFEEITGLVQTQKFDIKRQLDYGYSYKKTDLEFWDKQDAAAKNKLRPRSGDLWIETVCENLIKYLRSAGKINYWWSRGNTFDPVLLERLFRDTYQIEELHQYLPWWRVRDIRTYIDAKFNFSTKNGFIPVSDVEYWNKTFVGHDSTHDVAADVLRLQAIHRAENDLEQIAC